MEGSEGGETSLHTRDEDSRGSLGVGFRVTDLEFRDSVFGFRFWGFRFRMKSLGGGSTLRHTTDKDSRTTT